MNASATSCRLPVVLMALLALAQLTPPPEARPKPAQSPATGAIVIVRPPTLFGGSATAIAVDGKSRKHKVGRHSLAVNLQPGTYDFYGAKSPKPRASITIAKKQFLYVADRDDAVAQRALQDLRRSPTKRLVVRSGTADPFLAVRGRGEIPFIKEVVAGLSHRTALVPWLKDEPVGAAKLGQLFEAAGS